MTAHMLLSPEAWAQVREAYLAGAAADELTTRYGVSRSQFYARARAEGWRRSDRPGEGIEDAPFDAEAPAADPAELAELAYRRCAHALKRHRVGEARRWLRLHCELRDLAREQAAAARDRAWCEARDAREAAGR